MMRALVLGLSMGTLLLASTAQGWGPFSVGSLEAQTPTRPEVLSLGFDGNERFGDRQLRNAIVTRQTTCRSFAIQPFCWAGAEFAMDRAFLNPRTFRDDYIRLQILYFRSGYREAQVDTTIQRVEDTRVRIHYHIDEGRPIRITDLDLVGVADEGLTRELLADLPVRVGDPLDLELLDVTRDTLTRRLQNRGYAHADILRNIDIVPADYEAAVEYDAYTGPPVRFGEIEIVGNDKVSESVIRRMLPFQAGDPYRQELIFEAQRNIYNLEIFRHASIQQDLDHLPDSIVPLQVSVNEGDTHRVRAGGGWNTAECFTAESRWSSRNFQGGARRLVLRSRLSNLGTHQLEDSMCSGAGTGAYGDVNWVLSADFTQPWIFSPRNSFSASVYAERQSLQDVFVREALGLNLTLTRRLGRGTSVNLFYRPQLARLDAAEVFFCTSFLVCDPQDIDVLQASNRLAPVGAVASRDRTDRAFSPTGGYTALLDVEHASGLTGSDFDYERILAETTLFQSVGGDLVLAGRLRGGTLRAGEFRGLEATVQGDRPRIAHPQKRFYAGGANSVRGYAQNQLGPRVVSIELDDLLFPVGQRTEGICGPEEVADLSCDAEELGATRFFSRPTGGANLLEGNVELRFPVWSPLLRGAAFVDFGQVWSASDDNSLSDLVLTPGFGLRYSTPIGPIRVDVAYRPPRTERVPVVTTGLRPFDPERDPPGDRIVDPDGEPLDWVRVNELAVLNPRIPLEEDRGFSFRRVQLHISIGQAF
jgi:outer membrane protein assembly factor BamA